MRLRYLLPLDLVVNNMKKVHSIKYIMLSVFVFLSLVTQTAFAQNLGIDDVHKAGQQAGYKQATDTSLSENIGKIITILFSILGVLFTVLIVYAGYLWMTARGDDEQVNKAKNIIGRAVIGIIILLMAYSITNFVVPRVIESTVQTPTVE